MELTNTLADSVSLYLRQHANQAIAWQQWDEKIFELSRQEHKPIFISIGYSACHWCHVMKENAFSDQQVIDMLNEHFICIKVDREELLQVDRTYQLVHQLLTNQSGGWPLSVFVSHSGIPFFSATYLAASAEGERLGMVEVMQRVLAVYASSPKQIESQDKIIVEALDRIFSPTSLRASLSPSSIGNAQLMQIIDKGFKSLCSRYDISLGGFVGNNKFPQANLLYLMLSSVHAQAREYAKHNLQVMCTSGLYDHVEGGFFRYCVDKHWHIPHFEKMLTDNAQLIRAFSLAYLQEPDVLYDRAVAGSIEWLERSMSVKHTSLPSNKLPLPLPLAKTLDAVEKQLDGQLEICGFACAIDADNPQGEGGYYTFIHSDVPEIFTKSNNPQQAEAWRVHSSTFGYHAGANFQERWHLVQRQTIEECAAALGLSENEVDYLLHEARGILFDYRAKLVHPQIDQKSQLNSSCQMQRGLCLAALAFDQERYRRLALGNLIYLIRANFSDQQLAGSSDVGLQSKYVGLDDYAVCLLSCCELAAYWPELQESAKQIFSQLTTLFLAGDDVQAQSSDARNNSTQTIINKYLQIPLLLDFEHSSSVSLLLEALANYVHLVGDERARELLENLLTELESKTAQTSNNSYSLIHTLRLCRFGAVKIVSDSKQFLIWQRAIIEQLSFVPIIIWQPLAPADGEASLFACDLTACYSPFSNLDDFIQDYRDKYNYLLRATN